MTNSISVESLSVVYHSAIPVVTTELLSKLYGTDAENVKKNFARNAKRFTEGKHYFKLTGDELRAFKHKVTNCPFVKVAGNVRHLMLWTERGAARHAKMLETDQAWEVFEKLEDSYFSQKVSRSASKTTVDERTPLRDAINMLVSKKHLLYPEAYALIHQRFNVEHIDELTSEDLPNAIEYVHRLALEGEFLPKQTDTLPALSIPVRGVIAMHFDGSEIVRTEFVPEGATVATLDQFASLVRHRGGVVLWDEMEQRAFVRERAMLRL